MMSSRESGIEIAGLDKSEMAALRRRAKSLGISPAEYATQLVEEGLRLEQRARTETFDQIFAGVGRSFRNSGMSEAELNSLVDRARTRHHQRTSRKKR